MPFNQRQSRCRREAGPAMDVRQLNQFISVATHGSFSRAALESHVSQPALTRTVQMLEEELGVELLVRGSKGVLLTREGEALLRHARLAANVIDDARDAVLALRDERLRRVRIGTANLFNEIALPQAIAAIATAQPDLRFSVEVGLYDELIELLRRGDLDAVVTTDTAMTDDTGLTFEPAGEIESHVVAGTLAAASAMTDLDALRERRWAVLDDARMDELLSRVFADRGMKVPVPVVRTSSLGLLRGLIRSSDMIGWLPAPWAQSDLAHGNLVRIDLPELTVRRAFGVVSRRRTLSSALVEQLLDAMRMAVRRQDTGRP